MGIITAGWRGRSDLAEAPGCFIVRGLLFESAPATPSMYGSVFLVGLRFANPTYTGYLWEDVKTIRESDDGRSRRAGMGGFLGQAMSFRDPVPGF